MQATNDELNKRFFLLPTGMEVRKVYELMNSVALPFGIHLPTPITHRKVIASEAPQYLCNTVTRLYVALQIYCRNILSKNHRNCSTSFSWQHQKANKEEARFLDLKILKEWPLSSDAGTPPLTLCRLISSKHNIDKSPQKIQDHWKYLYKKHNIA